MDFQTAKTVIAIVLLSFWLTMREGNSFLRLYGAENNRLTWLLDIASWLKDCFYIYKADELNCLKVFLKKSEN